MPGTENKGRDLIEEIKDRLDIVDIIGRTVTLHKENNDRYTGAISATSKSGSSLQVNPKLQVWHDKAGGAGGDVFDWIGFINKLDTRGADFPDVLRIAADRAGVELEEATDEEKETAKEKADIQNLYMEAVDVYHKNLMKKPELIELINDKWGITEETILKYKIGYATVKRDLKGLDRENLIKSGLVYMNGAGTLGGELFAGRIVFPYWKNGKVVYLIGRATDETPKRANGGDPAKYQKLLVYKEGREYISPVVQNSYFYGEDSLRGADYCIVTEGVTDCITMLQAGIPCISPVTVNFRKEDHDKLISLTQRLETVHICNDNEVNESGLKGALETAEALEGAGIEARLIILPKPEDLDKIDIAEYMKTHTSEDFNKLIDLSLRLWDYKFSLLKIPENTTDKVKTFKKFINEDLEGMDPEERELFVYGEVRKLFKFSKGDVKKLISDNKPKTGEILKNGDRTFFDVVYKANGEFSIKLNFSAIAAHVGEMYNAFSFGGTLYIFKEGIYIDGTIELKAKIQEIIESINWSGETFRGSIVESTREIIHYMTYAEPATDYPFNKYGNVIPVQNGLLKINFDSGGVELMSFSPEYKFNFKLPVEYNPTADSGPIHNVILSYVDPTEREGENDAGETVKLGYSNADLLYQIPAQALLQMIGAATFKKAYLLQGDAHAGKSSYLEVLSRTIGQENISDVSLQSLLTDRFALADLEGKLLNCYDDLAEIPLKEGGAFKTVTGKYIHRIQRKLQQAYNAEIKAVHVYTCNTPPIFSDGIANDTAFWERWEFINFVNLFEIDPFFYDRVFTKENLSGFFNKVIETMMVIKKRSRLLVDSSAGEAREKWQSNADPLYRFLESEFISEVNKTIHLDKGNFFKSYIKYCIDKKVDPGKIPTSQTMFTKVLFKYNVSTKQINHDDGRRPWVYNLPYSWRDSKSPYYVEPIKKETSQITF
ncbi:hypothetical protein MSSIH_2003 [Methanosarcina siciliae HI350]|uniref:SF3 helicase domain-containing protein n=1 Tax=Methanosarcina siciliae HI350 TaxID=1434119 RepID=A0A0E3PDS2_9EURY|nr:DUF5906 domain-containing protein [Methanosarcina siciliae]AKB32693.1 hypothetical protein MSSIH_2003 [Methanosarcina siciliae HI350]